MTADRDAIAGPLIAAFEGAWTQIRRRHPDVPAAVLITGSGSDTRRRTLALGHYAAGRWQTAAETRDGIDEIFIGGEGLRAAPARCSPPCCTRPRTRSRAYAASRT